MLRRSLSAPEVRPVLRVGMHLAGPLAFRVCGQLPRGPSPAHPAVPLPLLAHSQASRGSSRTHLAVVLQGLVRATDPKVRRGHAPSHSMRADSRPLDLSPAHPTVLLPLLTHGRPSPRVVENAPEATSTAPAGADRAPHGASSSAWAPSSTRPSPTTGTFHAAGCESPRAGAFDAVRDSNPVPQRVTCPRPHRNVPARAGCPQPRRPSVGHPWHPEPLVRQLHQHRPPTTTSGPHTGARSDQAGEGTGTPRDARVRQARAADPHRSGWLTPIAAARRVRRGPPGAPGYGHRRAPAHCAGGP